MDNIEMQLKIMEAMVGVQIDVAAFMNQFDISHENLTTATSVFVENCIDRIVACSDPSEFGTILSGLAASSFCTGFLLANKLAQERTEI